MVTIFKQKPENICTVCGEKDCANEMCNPDSPLYMPQLGSPECRDFFPQEEKLVQPLDYEEKDT